MSYYDDERPRRHKSTKERSRRDDYDDSVYERDNRTSLVKRRDDSVSSVEEVKRDFPPGDRGGAYYRETTVRKSGTRPIRSRSSDYDDRYYDDRYDDRSYKRRDDDTYYSSRRSSRYDDKYDDRYDDRRDRRSRRYDSDTESSRSRSRGPKKERRKSTTENVIESLGLGGVVGALTGKAAHRSRSRSRDRDRDRARSRSRVGRDRDDSADRSRGKSQGREQAGQAIKAALLAGAAEAFRARKEPGGWTGERGKRILTAAITAGGVDRLISNKDDPSKHGTRDIIGSALAGLATNQLVNGTRSKSRPGSPDGRGRSQSRGGIRDLAAGGVVAATAKKMYDAYRSRSRGRERSRSPSVDSADSRPDRRKRSRSQSVSAGLAKGLSAIGLKDVAEKIDPDRRKPQSRHYDSDDDYYDDRRSRNGGQGYRDSRDVGLTPQLAPYPDDRARAMSANRAPQGYPLDYGPHHTGDPATDSDSDLGSSSDEEKNFKKGRRRQFLTAGLASVATIHAAHSVYQSMESRKARKEAVHEGEMSHEEARKAKARNRLQDAASIGIAALGIKGAYSEWKETHEKRQEMKEEREKLERHRHKRDARRRKQSMLAAQEYRQNGYTGSLPNLATNPYNPAGPQGPPTYYYDDNPYSAMSGARPPPPNQQYIPPPPPGPPPQGPPRSSPTF